MLSAWLELSYHNGYISALNMNMSATNVMTSSSQERPKLLTEGFIQSFAWDNILLIAARVILPNTFLSNAFFPLSPKNPLRHIQHSINALFPPFFPGAGSQPLKVCIIKSHLGCNLVELCRSEILKLTKFFQGLDGICVVTCCVAAFRDFRLIFFLHFNCEARM